VRDAPLAKSLTPWRRFSVDIEQWIDWSVARTGQLLLIAENFARPAVDGVARTDNVQLACSSNA